MTTKNGLDLAIDELYASGWSARDSTNCETHVDGRLCPSIHRLEQEFRDLGYKLTMRYVNLFDCSQAEWVDQDDVPAGAVVGASNMEAGIYALTQLRQSLGIGVNP